MNALDEAHAKVRTFSYGMKQRLGIAQALLPETRFLVLDEPINHLDIASRARFEEALANFKGTVLAVVHDRYFLEHFASNIWNVKNGKIVKY